ncbi:SMI1/KNR4 family protein [Saccharothrix sp. BKS2]|uniref:SMI1/KNR4 family protein n=1 Tax=Saccharothrix sp. BKS2 TaxID=3064400 RepID=UPI0039E7932C
MPVEYLRREPPVEPGLLARLEERIGHALPDEYRDYLLEQDGGQLEENDRGVDSVFGLGPVPDQTSTWEVLEIYRDRVPSWLLPVADDGAGNLYAISLRSGDRGTVWFWDHEEADEGRPPAEEDLVELAESWVGFLAGLEPC